MNDRETVTIEYQHTEGYDVRLTLTKSSLLPAASPFIVPGIERSRARVVPFGPDMVYPT